MIALKPWWVMVRETGLGAGMFLAGTALLLLVAQCYSAWDDRRMTVRFQADTLHPVYPVAVDTGGTCRVVFWPQFTIQGRIP